MTKIVLALLLGAACASSWWAAAKFGWMVGSLTFPLAIPCFFTTAAVVTVIISETIKTIDK